MEENKAGQAALEAELSGAGAPGTGPAVDAGTAGTADTASTGSTASTSTFNDDTEVEFEYGEKKEKKKIKIADLKKGYLMGDDYTKKSQELAAMRDQVKDLISWSEKIKGDPEAVELVIAFTAALTSGKKDVIKKATLALNEKIEEKKEETSDEIADMEKQLEALDPESAEAKILKKSIQFSKNILKTLKETQKSIEEQRSAGKAEKEAKEKETQEALIKEATNVLNTSLEALCDASKGGLSFDSDEAKSLWRQLTISHLKDNPKDYATKEDFIAAINEVGKKFHTIIVKHGETVVAKYLESKKGPIPAAGAGGGSGDKKPKVITIDNLQEAIEAEFADIESKKGKT